MGLLDALKQYVSDSMPGGLLNPEWNKANGQRLAEELNRGLLESTGINARDKRRAWERNKLDAVSGSSDTKASLNQQAYDSAMAMAGMAPMGLTVWHGSPHKFSKFDMSKIGTGEGAQAYGHGLYMAETEDVAKRYRDTLTNFRPDHIEASLIERGISPEMANTYAQFAAQKQGGPRAFEDFANALGEKSHSPYIEQFRTRMRQEMPKLKEELGAINGSLYKVDIPDEAVARMLDWDKPLSQQAPEVQAALEKSKNKQLRAMLDYAKVPYIETAGGEAKTMGEAFRLLNLNLHGKSSADSAKASALLAKQGIPGIRYLDGGSRAGGQGTSNYVLFSDQLPRILEVNGKPTGQTPWAAGEWQGLLGQ